VQRATQLEYLRDIPAPNLERPGDRRDSLGTVALAVRGERGLGAGRGHRCQGIASVAFASPDNLTAFPPMAVAADRPTGSASADKRFTVSKSLQLHSALPRFVDLGDALQGRRGRPHENRQGRAATVKLVAPSTSTVR